MREYYLMNKDEKMLKFYSEERLGGNVRYIEKERYTQALPIGFVNIDG